MRAPRQFPAFPTAASPAADATWRARMSRLRAGAVPPLARDIGIVLVIKAIVLCLLWLAFFRAPEAPHMAMDPQRVEQKLLAPTPHPEPPHAIR